MVYLELLWAFIQIGFFSVGGGLASLPLIQSHIVEQHGWLTLTEFADIVTVSEMTPGPISINAATFVGTKVAGFPGAIIATFGFLLPTLAVTFAFSFLYMRYKRLSQVQGVLTGLRLGVMGLISNAALALLLLAFFKNGSISTDPDDIFFFSVFLFGVCLFIVRKYKIFPILIIVISGVAGGIFYGLFG